MLVAVIGAGAVGLAIARAFALTGHEVIVIEAADGIGTGTSSRNSEVIHAGMYYPEGSAKARFCVAGRQALYAYCQSHGVGFRRTGKLIVATNNAEAEKISSIHRQGLTNGVDGLALLDGATARAMEPALACVAALHSPETGILDSHAYMLALQGDLEDHGGMIAFSAPVARIDRTDGQWQVHCGGREPTVLAADAVINAAGLSAWDVARRTLPLAQEAVPPRVFAKGNYFAASGRPAFTRLIYPAPVHGGLGIHLTLDLAGRMKFGPDVEWLGDVEPDTIDYRVDPARGEGFVAAIRSYWPDMPDGILQADYAGIRPKIAGPGAPAGDFMIQDGRLHDCPHLINLFGIESPGLTASLAIADAVVECLTG